MVFAGCLTMTATAGLIGVMGGAWASATRSVLASREQRYVTQQVALSYDSERIILDETPLSVGSAGKYVETYEFPDSRLELRTELLEHRAQNGSTFGI
jgi:hypothetical protein